MEMEKRTSLLKPERKNGSGHVPCKDQAESKFPIKYLNSTRFKTHKTAQTDKHSYFFAAGWLDITLLAPTGALGVGILQEGK